MTLVRVEDSTAEVLPVSLAEAKQHLRIDGSTEDTLLETYIKAAANYMQERRHLALITSTWEYTLDGFTDKIKLPLVPLIEVLSVEYLNEASEWVDVGIDCYVTGTGGGHYPAILTPGYGLCWPTPADMPGNVLITFRAGFGDDASAVPDDLRQALLLLIGHFYEHREAVGDERLAEVPQAFESLISMRGF
jgi:uncharacterized phiE125 gp8 family phage protein